MRGAKTGVVATSTRIRLVRFCFETCNPSESIESVSGLGQRVLYQKKKGIPFGIEITLAQHDHPGRDSPCLQAALCLAQLPDSTALYDASQAMRYAEAHRGVFSSSLPFSSLMCGCMQATDRPTREEAGYRNPEVVPVSL